MSNLLSNALRHGTAGTPVTVHGTTTDDAVAICVANQGKPVPDDLRQGLFQPFQRGPQSKGEGLGLGLYIASSIASAHGGRIDVACADGTTRFTLSLPLLATAG